MFLDPLNEAKAVKALRESIGALGEDEDLMVDVIEGETSLMEAIEKLLGQIRDCDVTIEGCKAVKASLSDRQVRAEKTKATTRALIEQAMSIAELDKLPTPTATISLAKGQRKVVINDESEIPSRFWVTPDPVLDAKALAAALKERDKAIAALADLEGDEKAAAIAALPAEIPGAELTNGAPTLTIRVR